jgi:hypothetical protein
MIMTAVATVALAVPSAALAHNGERHHHHRGRHHNHAHVLAFHAQAPASPGTVTAPPTTPMPDESAGTIASFIGGTLTITLSDGSTVSGKVTERTEIECAAPTAGAARFDDNDRGDDNGFDNSPQDGSSGPGNGRGDCPGHGDEHNGEQHEHCTSAALVQGASVKEAFLSVSSQGAEWVKVEL